MPNVGPKIFTLALLATLATVAGCQWYRDTAENRARFFLEALVREPDNRARLEELVKLSDGADPESVLDGLGTQLAVNYLRALHHQDIGLDFTVTVAQRADSNHRVVRVAATANPAALRLKHDGRIGFEVALEMSEEHGWRVTRVSVE